MDPITALNNAITEIRAQINAAIAGLPPLEQHEAASEIGYGIRALTRYGKELAENAQALITKAGEYTAAVKASAIAEAKAELLKPEGGFLTKADHDAAIAAAVSGKEKEIRDALNAEKAIEATAATRRAQLVTDKVLPAIAAEKLPITILSADDFAAKAAMVRGRLDKVAAVGVTAESNAAVIGDIASLDVDAAGETAFLQRLGYMEASFTAAKKVPAAGAAQQINPAAGGGASVARVATVTTPEGVRSNLL